MAREGILRSRVSEPKQFYIYILLCKSFVYRLNILMNTTIKAKIIVYCYNYNNQYSCFMCPSRNHYQCTTWEMPWPLDGSMGEECTIKLLCCHHTFLPFLPLLKFLMPVIICLPYCTCDMHAFLLSYFFCLSFNLK